MLVKNRGGVEWDLPEKEALKRIKHDGFTIVEVVKKTKTVVKQEDKSELEAVVKAYEQKYGKKLTNKKNDIEWIKSKL